MKIDCDCGKTCYALQAKKPEQGQPMTFSALVTAGAPGTSWMLVCDNCGRGLVAFVVPNDHCQVFGKPGKAEA